MARTDSKGLITLKYIHSTINHDCYEGFHHGVTVKQYLPRIPQPVAHFETIISIEAEAKTFAELNEERRVERKFTKQQREITEYREQSLKLLTEIRDRLPKPRVKK